MPRPEFRSRQVDLRHEVDFVPVGPVLLGVLESLEVKACRAISGRHPSISPYRPQGLVPLVLSTEVRPIKENRSTPVLAEGLEPPWEGIVRELPPVDAFDSIVVDSRVRAIVPPVVQLDVRHRELGLNQRRFGLEEGLLSAAVEVVLGGFFRGVVVPSLSCGGNKVDKAGDSDHARKLCGVVGSMPWLL